jgi:hypothetical protein
MDSRGTAGGPGPVGPGPVAPSRAAPRRRSARDQALARLERWKRGIAVATVVGFGALIGLVAAVGARGATTTPSQRGPSGDGTRQAAPSQSPDDDFFGNGNGGDDGGGGFGFGSGGGGSQAPPLGSSGAS